MPLKDFQELAKDKPELLKEVEQVFEKAEAAAKIQTANQDISRERDDLKAKLATAGTEKAALEGTKKDLETKLVEALKATPGKPDEAVVNGLKEQLKTLADKVESSEKAAAKAVKDKQAMDLKNSILAASGEALNANQVFTLMTAEGLAGIKEDGTAFYHKLNAEGQPVALKPEEAVAAYLSSNLHLKKSSGNGGSGGNPNPTAATATGLLANPEAAL